MKRLILMRHAKSGWSDPSASDHERALNQSGADSAAAMGAWLRDNALLPDHILCSDATRTQETLVRLDLPQTPTTITHKLYLAAADLMARMLIQQTDDCILMIAHNPGTAFFAAQLLEANPERPDFDIYPTCGTLVANFDINSWRDLMMGTGRMVHFTVPRSLID